MCLPFDELVLNHVRDNESAARDGHSDLSSQAFHMWLCNDVWLNDQRIGRWSHAYEVGKG